MCTYIGYLCRLSCLIFVLWQRIFLKEWEKCPVSPHGLHFLGSLTLKSRINDWVNLLLPFQLQLRQPAQLRSRELTLQPDQGHVWSWVPANCAVHYRKKKKPSHARWRPAHPDLHDLRPIGGSHMDRLHLRGNSCHTNCKKRMVRLYRSSICVGIIVSSWWDRPLRRQNHNRSKGTNRTCCFFFIIIISWTSAEAQTSCLTVHQCWGVMSNE